MTSIESLIRRDIPLAEAMKFHIVACSALETTALLPLEENRNHLQTQFGGSLYAASALGSYACLLKWLADQNLSAEVVIVEGSIKYLHPGRGDCEVRAWTSPDEIKKLGQELQDQGKSRIPFEATLSHEGKLVSRFKGLYQIALR